MYSFNILVVDDEIAADEISRRNFQTEIVPKESTCTFAGSSQEAEEQLSLSNNYDLILLDIVFPGQGASANREGLKLLERWKKQKRKEKVILMSAHTTHEQIENEQIFKASQNILGFFQKQAELDGLKNQIRVYWE